MDRRRLLTGLGLGAVTSLARDRLGLANEPAPRARQRAAAARVQPPEAVVLGTAQDAGVPQVNCFTGHCARVRAGTVEQPLVACLGLVDRDRRWLIDATPDLVAQVGRLLAPEGRARPEVTGRTVPLHEHLHGIFLTHAHMGHYTGLAQLGKEGAAPSGVPVWCSPAMAAFLRTNAPWRALAEAGHIDLREVEPGSRVRLSDRLEVEPFAVVHRDEYADTRGYIVHGPDARLLYVPDADVWDGWAEPFESLLDRVDLALVDGSFWSHDELGHRAQGDIPHPPISRTIERLAERAGRPPVWFIHLNHTNPLWDRAAWEYGAIPEGFGVSTDGQRFPL